MKYKINTYGCQMNIHESEKLAGMLKQLGYDCVESDSDNYDIILFNTCCIRDNAEKKVLGHIGTIKIIKEKNPDLIVVVVGCMTQQESVAEKLMKRFPFIDIILGANNLHTLQGQILKLQSTRSKIVAIEKAPRPDIVEFNGAYRTSGANAWVNIMYGCNNFCTYCIVPYVRGRERSRHPDLLIKEVKQLIADGYKEITLLGQNVNSYGNDAYFNVSFAQLLDELGQIEGKHRIRFMTSHPKDLSQDVIKVIAKHDTLCKYIHLPLQAGSDNVLTAMNRKYTMDYYKKLLADIRAIIPDCGISTDLMVGFPGETDEDFECTVNAVKELEFGTAFTYIYSLRSGTAAALMEQIPYSVKSERIQKLIQVQNEVTRKLSKQYEGRIMEVLCEGTKDENHACGRTDCGRLVTFTGDANMIGQFYKVKINNSQSAALHGEIVE